MGSLAETKPWLMSKPASAGPTNSNPSGLKSFFQTSQGLTLSFRVEVDEKVPAEDELIKFAAQSEILGNDVSLSEPHTIKYPLLQLRAGICLLEIPGPEVWARSAKRMIPEQASPCDVKDTLAHVGCIDLEIFLSESQLKQTHGERIRFLAGRTGNAQNPNFF